jgi:Domain of unknown function (DUF4169)
MTAGIVNLRTVRKQRLREQRQADAAENRVKFGRTRSEKLNAKANADLEVKRLDQAKRDTKSRHDE